MRLQYDVAIVGRAALNRELASIERRFVRHSRALQRQARSMAKSPGNLASIAAEKKRHGAVVRDLAKERAMMIANAKAASNAQLAADRRAHARRMRDARKEAAARVRFTRTVYGGVRGRVGSAVRSVGAFGAMAAGLGGGMLAASAFNGMRSKDKAARALANQAFGTSGAKGASRDELRASILNTSAPLALASGNSQADIIGSMRTFMSKAGDVGAAREIAPFITDLADASQTDLASAGEAAGNIFMSAMAQGLDSNEALKQTKEILAVMGGQAKEGAIELKDMATQAGKLMSASGRFKGTAADLANTMGAVGQMALAGGASSPDEAMTALMRLSDDLSAKGGNATYRKYGVDVFTDKSKTELRDPGELIMEAVSKTKGNIPALQKMFGLRSMKAVDPFRKAFVEAGGGDKGMSAMQGMFAKFRNLKMSEGEIKESAAFAREGTGKRFERIKERLDQKLGPAVMRVIERLIPAFEKMIPTLEKGAGALASFIEMFADNPLAGIGALIGAAVTAEIAKAALGQVVASALSGPLGTAAMGLLAQFGPLGLAVAAAAAGLYLLADHLGWLGPKKPRTEGFATRVDQKKAEQEVQDYLHNTRPFGDKPGKGFSLTPTGSHSMEDDYNQGLDPVTGLPFKRPDLQHTGKQPHARGGAALDPKVKLEGVDQFGTFTSQLMALPPEITAAVKAGMADGPNRGSNPTKPRGET